MKVVGNRRIGEASACNCVGPQRGEPRCPCGMRGVIQRDGRWIQPEKDLGPVLSGLTLDDWEFAASFDFRKHPPWTDD